MRRVIGRCAAISAGVAACSLALSPALSAVSAAINGDHDNSVSLKILGSIGSFTPVTSDQRLAKAYASAARVAQSRGFRFTPTAGSLSGVRSLTILVRAPASSANGSDRPERVLPNLGVAPVAYNLGVTKGLQSFAAGVGLDKLPDEQAPVVDPGKAPSADFSLSSSAKRSRFSTNLELESKTPLAVASAATPGATPTLSSEKTYAVDLSSSYALTHNLDVKAGLRYRGPSNRLVPLDDQAQDSQAIYVGTTFKF